MKKNLLRLRQYLDRASARGVSGRRTLLVELPSLALMRLYRKLAAACYRAADRLHWQDARTRSFLVRHTVADGKYFYVIAVPSIMHFLIPAMRLVESDIKVIFVLNGISRRERHLLANAWPQLPMLPLPTIPGAIWPHGAVLSLLLRVSPNNFGILDHDLFLFDHSLFRQLEFAENEFAICLTGWRNRATHRRFPGTHFLYLKVEPLRKLMRQYSADANIYKRPPRRTQSVLATLGLSKNNPPKDYQTFFDSFMLLSALAMHHGLKVRFLEPGKDSFVHVGSTSMGSPLTKPPILQYVNACFLARLEDDCVVREYIARGLPSSDRMAHFRALIDTKTADRIDQLTARIDSHSTTYPKQHK